MPAKKSTPKKKKTPAKAASEAKKKPAAAVKKEAGADGLSKGMSKLRIQEIDTEITYVSGIVGLIVLPILIYYFEENAQKMCNLHIQLPSGWYTDLLEKFEAENSADGKSCCLKFDFIQLRNFTLLGVG